MKHIPLGLRDYLPNDIEQRDLLIQKMVDVVQQQEYRRIITPSIEHYDQLQPALGTLSDHCIMFFDRSGSRLILRPDHTTPIARIATSRLVEEMPVKLFYHDPVFRKDPLLGETEIFQFGVEHIGDLSLSDEINMIKMLHDICKKVGLTDAEVHVAHPELFSDLSSEELDNLRLGDFKGLAKLPAIGDQTDLPESSYLTAFMSGLDDAGISNVKVNRGLCKDLSFYNGVYFDIVSPSYGKVIGSGGRYDSVLSAFGSSANAFGFAIRLHYLERALND